MIENYSIKYEILDYNKLKNRLQNILSNSLNKNKVMKHEPIGYSSCGFEIEHYSIGAGPIHVLYIGGCHGNEIIGVDFITQLMENLALANGDFKNFESSTFTIDFIPLLNPESFYITTYALNSIMGNFNEEEIEQFSKKYYLAIKKGNIIYTNFNNIIKEFSLKYNLNSEIIMNKFWFDYALKKQITKDEFIDFLIGYAKDINLEILDYISSLWINTFDAEIISLEKEDQKLFKDITLDCIPLIDLPHKKMKEKLEKMYSNKIFPLSTLSNFLANADGVNLNDNNPEFYKIFKEKMKNEKIIFGNMRYNNLIKSIKGPLGMPNYNMYEEFKFSKENEALLNFIKKQDELGLNFASINCHGTGGLIYAYPYYDTKKDEELLKNGDYVERDFSFLINNIIATEYSKTTGKVYKDLTNSNGSVNDLSYKIMGHPTRPTGVGDLLRKTYIGSFLLELSKMGGNPIAPYGDRYGNYELTITSNLKACLNMLITIKEIKYLYQSKYEMYKKNNTINYNKVLNEKFIK